MAERAIGKDLRQEWSFFIPKRGGREDELQNKAALSYQAASGEKFGDD
jgi:hypothetical protein